LRTGNSGELREDDCCHQYVPRHLTSLGDGS
jgi:hypothetical protein